MGMGLGLITTVFKFIKENFKVILVVLIFLLGILFVNEKRQRAAEKAAYEYVIKQNKLNIIALEDNIEKKVNKANEQVSEKMSLVVSNVDDLKLYNDSLYSDLKNEFGEVETYIKANISADIGNNGTSTDTVTESADSTYVYNLKNEYVDEGLNHLWESNTKFEIIKKADGSYAIVNDPVSIVSNKFKLEIDLGTKVEGDTTLVFAKSKSDLVDFTDIQSVKIYTPPVLTKMSKKKYWGIGPQFGTYMTADGKFVPAIGIGVSYNIIKF